MRYVVEVEMKRIIKTKALLFFLGAVLLLSAYSSYTAVKGYELWDINGFAKSAEENLKHGKNNAGSMDIKGAIASLRDKEEILFVDETNIKKLAELNYSGKAVNELSDREINSFFEKRLRTIEQSLNESSRFSYTELEKERLMEKAGKLNELKTGYFEGWKTLNRDIGSFIPPILVIISIVIMPLFADDSQTAMRELNRSSKKGKRALEFARIIAAFVTGSVLYFISMLFYFFVKMLPFGFMGGNKAIQCSEDTFFSVFNISFMEQFILNCLRGYVSLILVVSMTIMISVIAKRIMAGIVIIFFYWILLLIMEKMMSFEVNHMFANFMPLRLSGGIDFYIQNEVYRFAGETFDAIVWCPALALLLAAVMVVIALWRIYRETA